MIDAYHIGYSVSDQWPPSSNEVIWSKSHSRFLLSFSFVDICRSPKKRALSTLLCHISLMSKNNMLLLKEINFVIELNKSKQKRKIKQNKTKSIRYVRMQVVSFIILLPILQCAWQIIRNCNLSHEHHLMWVCKIVYYFHA